MKLRIRGDSLRLRLTRGEVQQLDETGEVRETIHFGARALHYLLRSAAVEAPSASFTDTTIDVQLPVETARAWAQSEQVSVEADQALPSGGALRLLIEKDFQCLAARDNEDDSDAFPNPATATGASC